MDAVVERATKRLGKNVKRAREAHNMTQEDLAHQAGIAVVQVSRIERGAREVRLTTLLKLCQGLKAAPNELLAGLYR